MHEPHGAGRRLQTAVLEPFHLEVEATSEPGLAADEVLGGHEPVVEGNLVGMHAAVPERVDGSAFDLAPARLLERERVPGGGLLLHHEQGEPTVAGRPVGVGAGEEHEDVGATGERRPRLHAADEIAAFGGLRRHLDVRDIGAHDGARGSSIEHDADHQLAAGDARQPPPLLLVGTALHDGPREDLGPGDERSADAERPPRQLLGGDDHPQVVVLAAGCEAAVLLGHRQAEPADLGQAADDVLRDVGVRAVDVLRDRPHLLGGETVERLADELEIVGQVRGPGPVSGEAGGDRLEELGRAALGDEVERGLERVGRHAPDLLASDDPARRRRGPAG